MNKTYLIGLCILLLLVAGVFGVTTQTGNDVNISGSLSVDGN